MNDMLSLDISNSSPNRVCHDLIDEALYCSVTHALREIKHRAHIFVPGSVTLLGAADEWNCLEEGEIYATTFDRLSVVRVEVVGPVLITRSPQIHPGDVQLVTTVRRPQLIHLINVVIFSCKFVS